MAHLPFLLLLLLVGTYLTASIPKAMPCRRHCLTPLRGGGRDSRSSKGLVQDSNDSGMPSDLMGGISDDSLDDGALIFRDPKAQSEWQSYTDQGVSPSPVRAGDSLLTTSDGGCSKKAATHTRRDLLAPGASARQGEATLHGTRHKSVHRRTVTQHNVTANATLTPPKWGTWLSAAQDDQIDVVSGASKKTTPVTTSRADPRKQQNRQQHKQQKIEQP